MTSAIGKVGVDVGAIDIIGFMKDKITRDIVVSVADTETGQKVVDKVKQVKGVKVLNVADRTFMIHHGGKIEMQCSGLGTSGQRPRCQ